MKKLPTGNPMERASRWMFTRIIATLARTLRGGELSVAQLAGLHLIDQAGSLRQSDLASELGRSASATSRLIDGLVERGLVERREAPGDRRVRELTLSPRGHGMLDAFGEQRVALLERLTRRLPRALVKTFIDNVEHLRTTRDDYTGRTPREQ